MFAIFQRYIVFADVVEICQATFQRLVELAPHISLASQTFRLHGVEALSALKQAAHDL